MVLDVGPSATRDGEDADLAVFVDRIAAAGSDAATGKARTAIRTAIAAGFPPPGLRKLAEGLAAAVFLPVRTGCDISGVMLLGRRLTKDYTDAEIGRAVRGIKALGARAEWWRELSAEAAGWPKR